MDLPIGFVHFHSNTFFNYQLNRLHALGYVSKEELLEAAKRIRNFSDYVSTFKSMGEEQLRKNHLKKASYYFRAAEFFEETGSQEKVDTYNRHIQLFFQAFSEEGVEQLKIPYQQSFLHAFKVPAQGIKKGTILAMGGFDSTIEEFYAIWKGIAVPGYEVVAFEGPGQGGTLRNYNLPFDHAYEKPVRAILDYLDIDSAGILGMSMGGYWAIRAAAFEPRIKYIIAAPPVYDWMEMTHSFNKWLVKLLLKIPRVMNAMVKMKMSVKTLNHTVKHTLYITQKSQPIEAVRWMLGMNKNFLHSEKITQDVLLLVGEHDAFQPPKLTRKQEKALINASSITTRVFTKEEKADQHCQMGNIGLLISIINNWLGQKVR